MKCEEFLCNWAQDKALPTAVQKWAKQALGHKCQQDNARHIKHLQGKQRAGAVTKVDIHQGDDYFEYEDQATVERLIMENNSAHFHLTEDTPLMMEPLLLELGYLANTEVAERILAGNYIYPPGTDQYTWEFLKYLQCSPTIDAAKLIDTSFSWEDFWSYWKKAKEQTLSPLSTLHFGHYKVVIDDAKLCELHAVFVDIAVNLGYSLKQWQKGLTVMLEQK